MLEYRIPVYLMENPGMDDLGVIFERLNKQGVPMSEEDRFFSALKMVWPQAHDLVWEIHSDPETGRTLSPTKIVHLAVRLAAAEDNSDELSLSAATFKRFIRRQDQPGKANLEIIRSLLEPEDGFPSGRIHRGLRLVRQALLLIPPTEMMIRGCPFHWRLACGHMYGTRWLHGLYIMKSLMHQAGSKCCATPAWITFLPRRLLRFTEKVLLRRPFQEKRRDFRVKRYTNYLLQMICFLPN